MQTFQRHAWCAVLAGLAAAPATAVAGADQAAIEAADANTEPPNPHSSIIPTVAVGGGFTLGFGVKNAAGTGGAVALRLAHVASRRALVSLEVMGAAQFARVELADGSTVSYPTDTTAVLGGGEYYVRPGFWLRFAMGVGSYHNKALPAAGRAAQRSFGIAGSVGAGVDLVALSHLHLGVEVMSTNLVMSGGMVNATALLLGLSVQ